MVSVVAAGLFDPLAELEGLIVGVVGDFVGGLCGAGAAADGGVDPAVGRAEGVGWPGPAFSAAAALQLALVGLVHEPRHGPVVARFGGEPFRD